MQTVRDIMDPDLPTVLPSDTVEHVVHLLRDHDLPGVAVEIRPMVEDYSHLEG